MFKCWQFVLSMSNSVLYVMVQLNKSFILDIIICNIEIKWK